MYVPPPRRSSEQTKLFQLGLLPSNGYRGQYCTSLRHSVTIFFSVFYWALESFRSEDKATGFRCWSYELALDFSFTSRSEAHEVSLKLESNLFLDWSISTLKNSCFNSINESPKDQDPPYSNSSCFHFLSLSPIFSSFPIFFPNPPNHSFWNNKLNPKPPNKRYFNFG